MTYIREIPPEDADGELKAVYERIAAMRGGAVPTPLHSLSLRPSLLAQVAALTGEISGPHSSLGRLRVELIATLVAARNASPT